MKLRLASTALDGRTVTLTVMQEGVTAGPLTVASWGTPLSAATREGSITVQVTRTPSMTAPEGVFFRVTGWDGFETVARPAPLPADADYDARDHDLIYLWNFDDPTATWTSAVNVLAEWKNPNLAQGPFVAHVYGGPGTYNPSCLVIEPSTGRTALFTAQVTVADPNVTFAGAATAYVAPDGDYSQAPAGAGRFTAFKAAVASIRSLPSGGRIMLARGKEFLSSGATDWSEHTTIQASVVGPIHWVAAPGAGADPIVRPIADANAVFYAHYQYRGRETVVAGLDIRCPWDSTTETGQIECGLVNATTQRVLIHKCKFTGTDNAFSSIRAGSAADWAVNSMIFNDCIVTDHYNYCLYIVNHGQVAILGSRLAQHVDARSGGPTKDPRRAYNASGPCRFDGNGAVQAHVDGCDLFVRTGWYRNYDAYNTIQPSFRWNQSSVPGCFLNLQRTSLEGGSDVIALTPQNASVGYRDQSVLIDHCVLVGSHMTSGMVAAQGTGVTVRNCLMIMPNLPQRTIWMAQFIKIADVGSVQAQYPDLYKAPFKAYGNTYISQLTSAVAGRAVPVFPRVRLTGGITVAGELVDANSVDHQPGASTPQIASAPLDAIPLWTPREKGPVNSWEMYPYTFATALAPGETRSIPYPPGRSVSDYEPQATQGTTDDLRVNGTIVTLYEYRATDILVRNTSASLTIPAGAKTKILLDRSRNPLPRDTTLATPAGSVWAATPLTGSAARGGATSDETPYDDLRLKVRPVHAAAGAVEV